MKNCSGRTGYDVLNLASVEDKCRCRVCKHILRDPIRLDCDHRICRLCVRAENNIIRCAECSRTTLLNKVKLDEVSRNHLQTLNIGCASCEWLGPLRNYQSHLDQSHSHCRCSRCNETFNSPLLLIQHQQTTCSQTIANCYLQPYGCHEKFIRCQSSKHYLSKIHQNVTMVLLRKLIANISKSNSHQNIHHQQMRTMTSDDSLETTPILSKALTTSEYSEQQQEGLKSFIDTLSSSAQTLQRDLQRVQTDFLQQSESIKTTTQDLTTVKMSIEATNINQDALQINMNILQQRCFSLKAAHEEIQSISYDGSLIWKITKFKERMRDAESERQMSIYSPPFYSSPYGYKMCARLYFFGDGNARRTHMSLFFVLMQSHNDSILEFPFRYKVIFCLFDLTSAQQHIVDSFRPDTKSDSFQKPKCNMNIASGIPKFVPLHRVTDENTPFVKNDTMFIRIMVDFQNLPREILRYAMNFNPALPMHFQQRMIEEEMQRRGPKQ